MRTKQLVKTTLPSAFGDFDMLAYVSEFDDFPHIVLQSTTKQSASSTSVNVRIHSECMTGDVFSSSRCDCGEQLEYAMHYINEHGGLILYLRQEGRGIGIINKMKAYNLQDQGLDTFKANTELGFHQDARDFGVAVEILGDLGIKKVNLLTNNPQKISALEEAGIEVESRLPVDIAPQKANRDYLKSKKQQMGHLLTSV